MSFNEAVGFHRRIPARPATSVTDSHKARFNEAVGFHRRIRNGESRHGWPPDVDLMLQ